MTGIQAGVLAINGGAPIRRLEEKPFPAWPQWDERDVEAVAGVVRSGKWSRHDGSRAVADFEERFAAMHGCTVGLATGNGAQAMRLAFLALGIQPGDEVIVPAYTFISTATTVVECNAAPVFADIDIETCNLTPETIEVVLSTRTRIIVPVHYAGQGCDMDGIMALAKRHQLAVVEDTAHCHCATYKGRMLGSFGEAGAFSFQAAKNLTAGEGGLMTTNNPDLALLARSIANYGRGDDGWYGHVRYGANMRMGELQGALLLTQLERLPYQTALRDANGKYLDDRLRNIAGITPLTRRIPGDLHAQSIYVFRYQLELSTGVSRDQFVAMLKAEGIPCAAGYPVPLYKQPVFSNQEFGPHDLQRWSSRVPDYAGLHLPGCQEACDTVVCLAQGVLLGTQADMEDVIRAVEKVVLSL